MIYQVLLKYLSCPNRNTDIAHLSAWKRNIQKLELFLNTLTTQAGKTSKDSSKFDGALDDLHRVLLHTNRGSILQALRFTFHHDYRHQLYLNDDNAALASWSEKLLRRIEGKLEDIEIALKGLEEVLTDVLGDNPGKILRFCNANSFLS